MMSPDTHTSTPNLGFVMDKELTSGLFRNQRLEQGNPEACATSEAAGILRHLKTTVQNNEL